MIKEAFLGVAFLALQHPAFPYRKAMKVFRHVKRPALAVLWSTFGNRKAGIKHYFRQVGDRPHYFQVYLMNGCAVRNGNAARGELFPRYSKADWNRALATGDKKTERAILKRVRKIRRVVDKYKTNKSTLVMCISLEDDLQARAERALVKLVRQEWPYLVCRNPNGVLPQSLEGADFLELHGGSPLVVHGVGYSLDGHDIWFQHRKPALKNYIHGAHVPIWLDKYKDQKRVVMLWAAPHQGLHTNTTHSGPPRHRKISVDRRDVFDLNRWLRRAQNK